MSNNAPFVLNDGTSDHTFDPAGFEGTGNSRALFQNKAETYIPGRETAVLSRKQSAALREVSMTVRVPRVITETLNSVDVKKVRDFATLQLRVLVPKDWESSDITELLTMGADVPAVAQVVAAAADNEWPW
jgi:hypothetical protein